MPAEQSLEERVRTLVEDGRREGETEHNAIRANAEADKLDTPTEGWGRYEEIARESDLVVFEGWVKGIEDGLLAVARAIDELRS